MQVVGPARWGKGARGTEERLIRVLPLGAALTALVLSLSTLVALEIGSRSSRAGGEARRDHLEGVEEPSRPKGGPSRASVEDSGRLVGPRMFASTLTAHFVKLILWFREFLRF